MRAKDWLTTKAYLVKKKYGKQIGQITLDSELGRWITLLSSLESTQNIVEIGVWNGRGSTACILKGVSMRKTRNGVNVLGLETNRKMYEKAKRHLRKNSNYSLFWGGVVGLNDDFLQIEEMSEVESMWWVQDKKDLQASHNCLDKVPPEIDLLILDGGEFTSYAEFRILEGRCTGFIVLDDVRSRKNSRVHSELQKKETWFCIANVNDRNGFSIWCKEKANL